jgi:hypothetical protein
VPTSNPPEPKWSEASLKHLGEVLNSPRTSAFNLEYESRGWDDETMLLNADSWLEEAANVVVIRTNTLEYILHRLRTLIEAERERNAQGREAPEGAADGGSPPAI